MKSFLQRLWGDSMKKDITGQRFGRLVAIKPDGTQGNNTKWLCHCDCGNYKTTNISSLTRGLCRVAAA